MKSSVLCIAALASAVCLPGQGIAEESTTRWSAERTHALYDAQPWLVGCNFTPSSAINAYLTEASDIISLHTTKGTFRYSYIL